MLRAAPEQQPNWSRLIRTSICCTSGLTNEQAAARKGVGWGVGGEARLKAGPGEEEEGGGRTQDGSAQRSQRG